MLADEGVSHERIMAWYDAWNRRDWSVVEEIADEHFTCEDVALGKTQHDRVHYLEYARAFVHSFPDGKFTVSRISGAGRNGEVTVVEYSVEGTQSGDLGLFPPTNLRARMKFCDLLRFHNGKLVSCRTYYDLYGPLADLGHIVSRRVEPTRAA